VGRAQLAHLYGVKLDECVTSDHRYPDEFRGLTPKFLNSLIWLYVLDKGNYRERIQQLRAQKDLENLSRSAG